MHGNVWEWCKGGERRYPDPATAADQKEPIKDPKGPLNGEIHVLRGGSWINAPRHCRSAFRGPVPVYRGDCIGFRVVFRPGLKAP